MWPRLKSLCCPFALAVAAVCVHAQTPDPILQVRLQTPISSYSSRPGDPVRALVIAPFVSPDAVIPRYSLVVGRITDVAKVGRGVRRERASITMELTEWMDPRDGSRHALQGRLSDIDNAREQVTSEGRIRGILAAGGPPGFLLGMWRTPNSALFMRTAGGFAGMGHFLFQGIGFTPLGFAGAVALRFSIVRWPEPEINLPSGADLKLLLDNSGGHSLAPLDAGAEAASPALVELALDLPLRAARPKTQAGADFVNVLFLGTEEEVKKAFTSAGWHSADVLSRRSVYRGFRALTSQDGYATAPMSPLLVDGAPAALSFQKALNTMYKRHHVRLWKRAGEFEGRDVWLAAATHDIGLRREGSMFSHQIDPYIDRERNKVLDDLAFAGCVQSLQAVERPGLTEAAGKDDTITDGRLAVVTLRPCTNRQPFLRYTPVGGSPVTRVARRLVLEGKHAILRGNVYYWGYRLVRHVARRDKPQIVAVTAQQQVLRPTAKTITE